MDLLLKTPVPFGKKPTMPSYFVFFCVSAPISKNTLMTFFSDLYLPQGIQKGRGVTALIKTVNFLEDRTLLHCGYSVSNPNTVHRVLKI